MKGVCKLLGTEKLNTMAHHPEFDGAIERFNRTLKDHPSKASSETYIPIGPVYSDRGVARIT